MTSIGLPCLAQESEYSYEYSSDYSYNYETYDSSDYVYYGGPVVHDESDSVCGRFTRDLTLGSTGSDVVKLQNFLEEQGHLTIPAGVAKGYFGASVKAALAQYQAANGISPASGYFGPITKAYIAARCNDSQPETVPPEQIPFGNFARVWALSQVTDISIQAYTFIRGERVDLDHLEEYTGQLEKIEDIDEALKYEELDFTLDDPRSRVYIEAYLEDEGGNELFSSSNSFLLQKKVVNGEIQYEIPSYATDFYWDFYKGVSFDVHGIAKVTALSDYSEYEIRVNGDRVHIPEYVLNFDGFNTLKFEFKSGLVIFYDENGVIINPEHVEVEFGNSQVNGINRSTITRNGVVYSRSFWKEYGYNPVLEVTVESDQFVTFDIADGSNSYFKPILMRYTTLQNLNEGGEVSIVGYEGSNPSVYLEAGTYYFMFEWPTWSPGKG